MPQLFIRLACLIGLALGVTAPVSAADFPASFTWWATTKVNVTPNTISGLSSPAEACAWVHNTCTTRVLQTFGPSVLWWCDGIATPGPVRPVAQGVMGGPCGGDYSWGAYSQEFTCPYGGTLNLSYTGQAWTVICQGIPDCGPGQAHNPTSGACQPSCSEGSAWSTAANACVCAF